MIAFRSKYDSIFLILISISGFGYAKEQTIAVFITTTLAVTCFLSAQLSYAEDASDISSTAALLAGGAVAGAGIGIAASGHAGSNPEDKSFCDLNCRTYLQKNWMTTE